MSTRVLQAHIDDFASGTVIRLTPGVYRERITIRGGSDLTIRGGPRVVFDGGVERPASPVLENVHLDTRGRTRWDPQYARHVGHGMLEVENCTRIRILDLRIRNSWPNGIRIDNSQDVAIAAVQIEGGTNGVFALGKRTRRLTVARSRWNQDPSGAIWSSLDWQHVHHGRYNFFNGAFFQARNIGGEVTLRDNVIANAFNGVRIKNTDEAAISHITIANNSFNRISDNAIEGETAAGGRQRDWAIVGNRFENFHAPLSFDGFVGVGLLIEGNAFIATERPRTQLVEPPSDLDPHNGTFSRPRFIKLDASGRGNGPEIEAMVVRQNVFVTPNYPIRLADTELPPGTLLEDNLFVGLRE